MIFDCAFLGGEVKYEDKAVRITAKTILRDIQECKKKPEIEEQTRRRPELFSAVYDFIVSDTLSLWRAVYGEKEDRKALYQEIKFCFEEVSEDNDDNNKLINGVIKTVRENYLNED